jgi:hypothetical protein
MSQYVLSKCNAKRNKLLSPWSRVLLEKASVTQLFKNSPRYGTRRFITVFTAALHWYLSWARSIHSIPPNHISLRSILIVSSHLRLRLPSCFFPSGFPTKTMFAFLFSQCVLHTPLISSFLNQSFYLYLAKNTSFRVFSLCNFLQSIISSLFGPNILLSTVIKYPQSISFP